MFTRKIIVINFDNLYTIVCIYWKKYIPILILPFNVESTLSGVYIDHVREYVYRLRVFYLTLKSIPLDL